MRVDRGLTHRDCLPCFTLLALAALAPSGLWAQACCVDGSCQELLASGCEAEAGEYLGWRACFAADCASGTPFYREHDPGRPPAILTDPPLRHICRDPFVEPETPPAGTRLTFYKINEQGTDPDPSHWILCAKAGDRVLFHWPGHGCWPSPQGACCLPDLRCADDETAGDCLGQGGFYRGDGSRCSLVTCATAGACIIDGVCLSVIDPSTCEAVGGLFYGEGTSCEWIDGACCLPDGSCQRLMQRACADSGGTWQGTCRACPASGTCTTGACCLADGYCLDGIDAEVCTQGRGGSFGGPASTCTLIPCGPPTEGACCQRNSPLCLELTARECIRQGWTLHAGQSCDAFVCPQ